jgi:hypothetical protein
MNRSDDVLECTGYNWNKMVSKTFIDTDKR